MATCNAKIEACGKETSPSDDLEWLKLLEDPHKRGLEFQRLVESLFAREHFTVKSSPGLAPDRQIDLIATRHDESYLIETKWWRRPLGPNAIGALLHRLSSAPPSTIGLLVGYSGFTQGAINRVEAETDRPILLVSGAELERISWNGHLLRLLRQKRTALQTDGRALFLTGGRTHTRESTNALPTSPETFVLDSDQRAQWLECRGDYGQFTFVQEMPDIDWIPSPGVGVSFDVQGPISDQDDVIALVDELSKMRWVTDKSR